MSGYDVSITITTRWREAGKPPSPEPVQKTEQAVRRTTAALKEQQGVLSRFIQNWKSTFAVFAMGYASVVGFLEVVRAVTSAISRSIEVSSRWESEIISLTATLTSFMRLRPGETYVEAFERALPYVRELHKAARQLDAEFIGTADEGLVSNCLCC